MRTTVMMLMAAFLLTFPTTVEAQDEAAPAGDKEGWDGHVPPGWAKWKKERRAKHKAHVAEAVKAVREHAKKHKHAADKAGKLVRRMVNAGLTVELAAETVRLSIAAGHTHAAMEVVARHVAKGHHAGLNAKEIRGHAFGLIKNGHKGKAFAAALRAEHDRRHARKKAKKAKKVHHKKAAKRHEKAADRAEDKGHDKAAKRHDRAAKRHDRKAKKRRN